MTLWALGADRPRPTASFIEALDVSPEASNEELFNTVFPEQVDQGSRRPTTWKWMLARIRDGNGIAPPLNLIDVVTKAQEAQLRKEAGAATEYDPSNGGGVIQSDAIKRGLAALSDERVEDTLLAEAGEHAPLIEQFRDGRAEHNEDSLAETVGVPAGENIRETIKPLIELGFLEQTGRRTRSRCSTAVGSAFTQGKAFAPDEEVTGEEEI